MSVVEFDLVPGVVSGLVIAAAVFAALRRHFGARRGAAVAALTFLLYLAGWAPTGPIATVCVVAGILAYGLVRIRFSVVPALVTAFGVYLVLDVILGMMFYASLVD